MQTNRTNSTKNIISCNIIVGSFQAPSVDSETVTTPNLTGQALTLLFREQTRYTLLEGSPAYTAGADGGEVGLYGGAGAKLDRLPAIPKIVQLTVAGVTTSEGALPVTFKVEAED